MLSPFEVDEPCRRGVVPMAGDGFLSGEVSFWTRNGRRDDAQRAYAAAAVAIFNDQVTLPNFPGSAH
jgi:hypothetical protein